MDTKASAMVNTNEKNVSASATELRRRAENLLTTKMQDTGPMVNDDALRLLHELQVYQVELELQNTELRQARDEVESTLEKYTDLYDYAPVAYLTLDCDGTVRSANLTAASLLGIERSLLLGQRFGLLFVKDHYKLFSNFIGKVFASREKESCEVILNVEPGSQLYVQIEAVVIGAEQECRIAVADITGRKQSEEAVRKSEERLALAASATQIGMFDWDLTKGKVLWTQTHEAIFGYAPATTTTTTTTTEHDQHRWTDRVHPEDLLLVEAESLRCLRERKPLEVQYRIIWPDGSLHWVETKGVYQYDSDGKASRMLGVVMDITERKRVEDTLRKNDKRLSDIYATMSEGLAVHEVVYDNFGKAVDYLIIDVNPAFESITGIERSRAIGKKASELYGTGEAPYLDTYAEVASTGKHTSFEVHFVPMNMHFHISVFSPDNGKFATIFQDITERKQAQDALLESEERHRVLAETMLQGVVHQNADGKIISMNPAAERILGKSREELLGSNSVNVEHDTIRENGEVFPGMEHPTMVALRTGLPVRGVIMGVFNPKMNEYRWIGIDAVPVFRPGETHPLEVYSVFGDITERKQVEIALKESEEKFHTLADSIPNLAWSANGDGYIKWFNQRWYDYTGTTPEQMEGWGWQNVHDPIELPKVLERWQASLATREPFEMTFSLRGADGVFRPFLTRIIPLKDTAGCVLQWFGTNTDVSELNRIEQALRVSEALYRGIGESIDYGVWVCTPDGRNTYASESFLKMVGITQEQCSNFGWGNVLHPDDAEHTIAAWQECVRTGGKWDIELRFRSADGQWRHVLARGVPVKNDQGEISCWAGINLDITKLKQAENALKEMNEELENRVEIRTQELREKDQMLLLQTRQAAMGEMIGNIAHQWRQPLNTLGLNVQQLSIFYELGEFTKEYLDQSVSNSMVLIQHMSQTIDDFRNYFKPDNEKIEFKVREAIASTLALVEDNFKNKNIAIEVVTKDYPCIYGYRNEFSQALLNILNNAGDVLAERKINESRVTITLFSEGGSAVVTIADNAGGVSEEIIGKIFDPYFTTKGPQQGTGVGLFMAKTIIEKNMGGRLTVSNNADGAEFRIKV